MSYLKSQIIEYMKLYLDLKFVVNQKLIYILISWLCYVHDNAMVKINLKAKWYTCKMLGRKFIFHDIYFFKYLQYATPNFNACQIIPLLMENTFIFILTMEYPEDQLWLPPTCTYHHLLSSLLKILPQDFCSDLIRQCKVEMNFKYKSIHCEIKIFSGF